MTLGRKRRSAVLRVVPAAAIAAVATTALAEGCGSSGGDTGTTTTGMMTTTSANGGGGSSGTATGGGGMGTGAGGGTVMVMPGVSVVSEGNTPFDATPDPNATTVYFTANDPAKGPGVFRVPYAGGTATPVAAGDPFVAPFGIVSGSDGKKLYVADPGVFVDPTKDASDKGAILQLDPAEGIPSIVKGTEGYQPRSLDVWKANEGDVIYFTGTDPTGKTGVFLIAAAGGMVTTVISAPLVEPSGIAIDSKGANLYVADVGAPSRSGTIIYKSPIMNPMATAIVSTVATNYPAGVAINMADSTLWVSGFDPASGGEAIIEVNLADNSLSPWKGDADTDVTPNIEPGGLHRARNADALAFVDGIAGAKRGTVYVFAK